MCARAGIACQCVSVHVSVSHPGRQSSPTADTFGSIYCKRIPPSLPPNSITVYLCPPSLSTPLPLYPPPSLPLSTSLYASTSDPSIYETLSLHPSPCVARCCCSASLTCSLRVRTARSASVRAVSAASLRCGIRGECGRVRDEPGTSQGERR